MLLQRLRAVPRWLDEARHLWIALLVVLAAFVIAFRPGTTEPVIRLTGLVLQIFGLFTVAWGIAETRALYGHKPFYKLFAEWALRFPPLGRPVRLKGGSASISATVSIGSGWGTIGAEPGATLEQRVEALEKNLPLIHKRISGVESSLGAKVQNVADKLSQEERARRAEDEVIAKRLESTATGGVHISAIGVVWLFFGVTLSTAGIEIQQLLLLAWF